MSFFLWFPEKDITVPGPVSKLFANHRFKMWTNILPGTGDNNDNIEGENKNKNIDNVSSINKAFSNDSS